MDRRRGKGRKRSNFSNKVSKLYHEGYGQKQAVAIAYAMQRKGQI